MAFLDTLQEYLRGLLEQPAPPSKVAPPAVDAAAIRSHLIQCLERIEQRDRAEGQSVFNPVKYEFLLQTWQQGDRVVRFAQRLNQMLHEGMSHEATPQELQRQLEVAIARRLGLKEELPSLIRTMELDRLASRASSDVFKASALTTSDIDSYASSIRATRRAVPSLSVTPIGRVLLELTGRDAIRWLLQVEVAQSAGPEDDWRVSRETAVALARQALWIFNWDDTDPDFPHSWTTIRRLRALGLVSLEEQETAQRTWLRVLPLGQELLGELAADTESPMSILARSLLADLTLSAAEVASKPSLEDAGARASIAEATARQARLVAHEIRNALVPVKTSLGILYREALLSPTSETIARRREPIDRGIDAVFQFVDQLVRISALAATPPEPFDPLSAIHDAISHVQAETGHRIEASLPASLPPISGHRARFVMAITNVLRNAAQAVTGPKVLIRISAEPKDNGRAVLFSVEDNGPGVPENMRQAIFEEGISLRPGGIGMGLALVREVIEKEMRGLVECEVAQLGGARFVIRLPTAGVH